MNSKKRIILIGSLMILLVVLSIVYLLIPKVTITLNKNKRIDLNIGETYEEYGAQAKIESAFLQKQIKVSTKGKVNTEKIGKYIITYTAKNKYQSVDAIRIINVKDGINPEIKINNKILGCKTNNLVEYDVSAIDNYDGNITDKIKYEINNDEITFFVKDSSNNATKITEKINYIDDEPPKITLKGEKNIYLKKGEQYEEFGATSFDSCEGNLTETINISGTVDVNTPGTYEITYTSTDKNKKSSYLKRTIVVSENENKKEEIQVVNNATIYLTFDDGPGPYTEELLKVLNEYNVKSTFFVTAQFPKYQHLIKKEYEQGHSIGIHTYSHKWSIYNSLETFMDDFQKIENVIYEETGNHTKIFRFPGGSSNTISRNYCKGIMTNLSTHLQNEGYVYFDWTFDSGDTSKNNNSVKAILDNFKRNLKGDGEYIVLMHDIKENTLKALPEIINYAQTRGYKFDKLSEKTTAVHLKIAN